MKSLRKKQSSTTFVSEIDAYNTINDESFADSVISKRFSRKKNSSNEITRNVRLTKAIEPLNQEQYVNSQANKMTKKSHNLIKPEDLFITITNTPVKNKNCYAPVSSDRTQSTYIRQRYQTEMMIGQYASVPGKNLIVELKQELKLKNNQLMFLEDETMKLKRELQSKQEEHMKGNIKKQKSYHSECEKLKSDIKILNIQIQQRNNEIKVFKKTQMGLQREIKILKYDKILLEKQIEQIYKKRLPKDMKELMSYRQVSLMRQLDELKLKVQENKSQHETKLEAEVRKLKEENQAKLNSIKKLQVQTRILSRKIIESEKELKENIDNFAKYYNSMKQSQNEIMEQLKKARKQNLKLRRLQILNHPHSKKYIDHNDYSQQSLNLSLQSSH